MEYRPLGRTGVQVSKLCLGTMMFGAWGNTDHDDSVRIIHARSTPGSTSSTPPTSTRPASPRRSSARRSRAAATTSCSRRSSSGPMGEDPNRRGVSRRWIVTRGRALAAAARHRPHRPLPDAPSRPGDRRRGDARRADRPRAAGQGPLHRLVLVLRGRDRRGAVDRARAAPASASARSSRRTRCSSAGSSSTCCRRPHATAWASSPTARWPAAGCPGAGTRTASPTSPARQRLAARFDMSLAENQRKLEVVEQLAKVADDAGLSLIELAIAFVVNHPAVTSAIIGPRTMEQLDSQLPAAGRHARRRGPRPHRRNHPTRRDPQPRRHQLRRAGPPAPALRRR